jgi:hypothetical protein
LYIDNARYLYTIIGERYPRFSLPASVEKNCSDFSVVLFRLDFMLASEEYPMKAHKNQSHVQGVVAQGDDF